MPSRSTIGSISRPDQKKRWKARSAHREANIDAVLGGDEAGRPAERRADAAQGADQDTGGPRLGGSEVLGSRAAVLAADFAQVT